MMSSEEARERQQAEIEFVVAAYEEEEAWVEETGQEQVRIHRRLYLSSSGSGNTDGVGVGIPVLLSLSLPAEYPIAEDAVLMIEARIANDAPSSSSHTSSVAVSSSSCTHLRKQVIDGLPSLVDACRLTAVDCAGSEAVFAVLSRADEWSSMDWADVVESSQALIDDERTAASAPEKSIPPVHTCNTSNTGFVLGRRLIHSHHIIAPTKRKAIVNLAQQCHLGGYSKIGWPGVIVVEGEESDCLAYVDEIRQMRWQHLVVRGEEHISVRNREELEQARVLPQKMQEVGDKMSVIAEHCKRAGLEELFLTSMKIYTKKESVDANRSGDEEEPDTSLNLFWRYGALCHVDHMRDGKGYRKWLRKAAAAAGCTLMLKICDTNIKRPLIVVAILGEEDDVRMIMKRWRTTRVDVDSSGKPCLERMMTVLVEENLPRHKKYDDFGNDMILKHMDYLDDEDQLVVSCECLGGILRAIGGSRWSNEFVSLRDKR